MSEIIYCYCSRPNTYSTVIMEHVASLLNGCRCEYRCEYWYEYWYEVVHVYVRSAFVCNMYVHNDRIVINFRGKDYELALCDPRIFELAAERVGRCCWLTESLVDGTIECCARS